jgi:hypothetical protein
MEYNESNNFSRVEDENVDLCIFLIHVRDVFFMDREFDLHSYGVTPEQVSLLLPEYWQK